MSSSNQDGSLNQTLTEEPFQISKWMKSWYWGIVIVYLLFSLKNPNEQTYHTKPPDSQDSTIRMKIAKISKGLMPDPAIILYLFDSILPI